MSINGSYGFVEAFRDAAKVLQRERWQRLLIGPPRDPFQPETQRHLLLVAFLAWVGLGANGLSSACYGPEKTFLALGSHVQLAPYLAVATAATVLIIALAYNQVFELCPSGGGGYKIATQILGPYFGLVSGSALLVDYMLSIAIAIASGTDALFSLLPVSAQAHKLPLEVGLVLLLLLLNLRGMREPIKLLAPIMLGFFLSHGALIGYGIISQTGRLTALVTDAVQETLDTGHALGWVSVIVLFVRAYALGGSTYTGVEAVSNNLHLLVEPRLRTGRLTMLYSALSLAFTAGGIVLLYSLWQVQAVHGQTLNAVLFGAIIPQLGLGDWGSHLLLLLVLALEGGLLFVAANSVFISGPSVLSNMAADSWAPHQFRNLSSRLVRHHGVLVVGICALAILLWTQGQVAVLVVFYSINMFLSLSFSKLGLCLHWWRSRGTARAWRRRLALSLTGLAVTATILLVTLVEKFAEGGWATVVLTAVVIGTCLLIRQHYDRVQEKLRKVDALFASHPGWTAKPVGPEPEPVRATAVFLVTGNIGAGMHLILWAQRLFPGQLHNYVLLSAGEVDSGALGSVESLQALRARIDRALRYYEGFFHSHEMAATSYAAYGTDPVDELEKLIHPIMHRFPNSICFANKLILPGLQWPISWLHNQTALALQERLHLQGIPLIVLPMSVE